MPTLRELAVDAAAYTPLWPGVERIDDPRFCMLFLEHLTFVQRLRLDGDVAEVVDTVRSLAAGHGRTRTLWWIGDGAEPGDLVERLLGHGLVRFGDETLVAMALDRPLDANGHGGVPVREVHSARDYLTALAIEADALGIVHEDEDGYRRAAEAKWAAVADSPELRHHLAVVDGEPVAMSRSAYGDAVFLMGGATLPSARRRGAYTALLAARSREGGGRPLVAQASSESQPILSRLGFRRVGEIHVLADEMPR